jgi:hypothetical protein
MTQDGSQHRHKKSALSFPLACTPHVDYHRTGVGRMCWQAATRSPANKFPGATFDLYVGLLYAKVRRDLWAMLTILAG